MKDQIQKLGPFLLRVTVGYVFIRHGWLKFFRDDASKIVENIRGFEAGLAKLQVPMPGLMAWVVASVELLCGALLVLGVASRIQAALLACVMGVAVMHVHRAQGLFLSVQSGHVAGYEYALVLLAACVSLVFAGGGLLELCRFPGGKKPAEGAKK